MAAMCVSTGAVPRNASRFNCGNNLLIELDLLCDGRDDCAGGDDETAVICDSKLDCCMDGGCSSLLGRKTHKYICS